MPQPDNLAAIAAATRHDDPLFAYGLSHGRPVAPREYRHVRLTTWIVIFAMAQSVALLAGQSGAAILLGVSTLVLARWARGRRSSRCR